MGRGRPGIIRRCRDEVIEDLKDITVPLTVLGKKDSVSRQALSQFAQRGQIQVRPRPRGHAEHSVNECPMCQEILRISGEPHSKFLSRYTIRERLGPEVSHYQYLAHLNVLKKRGLVHPNFGRLISEKVEKAYSIYFEERLLLRDIGNRVGLRNFASTIRNHRQMGWDVPRPLLAFTREERWRVLQGIRHKVTKVRTERKQQPTKVDDKIPSQVPDEIFPGRIERPLLSDQVAYRLKRLILTGKLKAGQRLIQEKLALRYNVSRMAVVWALSRLKENELITRGNRWGWVVK